MILNHSILNNRVINQNTSPKWRVGDFVSNAKTKNGGLVIYVRRANSGISHVENNIYPYVYYVLFNSIIEGPLFQDQLLNV